jgi:hypothetical protein
MSVKKETTMTPQEKAKAAVELLDSLRRELDATSLNSDTVDRVIELEVMIEGLQLLCPLAAGTHVLVPVIPQNAPHIVPKFWKKGMVVKFRRDKEYCYDAGDYGVINGFFPNQEKLPAKEYQVFYTLILRRSGELSKDGTFWTTPDDVWTTPDDVDFVANSEKAYCAMLTASQEKE